MQLNKIIDRNFSLISDEYREFVSKKEMCRECSIYDHYKRIVHSEGNAKDPTFMFIGEAPGKDEVEQIRPFIGLAGQRLRDEFRKHSKTFSRETVLVSNVIPCRPLNNKFPNNDVDVEKCVDCWLEEEVAILKPKIIVTLGNHALRTIRQENGITNNRGKWKFLSEYRAWSFATYHPSYVLRCERSKQNHVVDEFENDIKTIALTWNTIVGSDERMSMNQEEWERQRALDCARDLGLIQ